MRKIPLNQHAVGKKLGKTLYNRDGTPYLRAGIELTAGYVKALKRRGFAEVIIQNEIIPGLEIDDAVNEETRAKATTVVSDLLAKLTSGETNISEQEMDAISDIVDDIIQDIESSEQVVYGLSTLRTYDTYTFHHSVNVCILSCIIGRGLGLHEMDLKKLAIGAILHDVGKSKIPIRILNKPGKLTKEEFNRVREHPETGYEILREILHISILSAHVAYQHHERLDGSGYPRQLTEENIHLFGKISAVADVYDAISSNRVYKKGIPLYKAAEYLQENAGGLFDPTIVKTLLQNVAIYPTGTVVLLSTNRFGVVVNQNPDNTARPEILIIAEGRQVVQPYKLNLNAVLEEYIKGVIVHLPEFLSQGIQKYDMDKLVSMR